MMKGRLIRKEKKEIENKLVKRIYIIILCGVG